MKKLFIIVILIFSFTNAVYGTEYIKFSKDNVLSFCSGDFSGGGEKRLVVITVADSQDGAPEGQTAGDCLYVVPYTEKLYKKHKMIRKYDMRDIKPLKAMAGDVDGDGKDELSVIVYKTAEYHKIMAKRPFFFKLDGDKLVKMWLGSRLSRPFNDYILKDMDGDGICEIVAEEMTKDGKLQLRQYEWEHFGFTGLCDSVEYEESSDIEKKLLKLKTWEEIDNG